MTYNTNTEFAIYKMSTDEIEKAMLNGEDYGYAKKFTARTTADIVKWLRDHKATDEAYSIEMYDVDEDGEFAEGSDFATVTGFIDHRARNIRSLAGLTQQAFAERYNIPARTIQTWEATSKEAHRNAPDYVLDLIEKDIRKDES